MKPGEPFNPRHCGFRPYEYVSKLRDLGLGPKFLYTRMCEWARVTDGHKPNERNGELWRSEKNMGLELGKSDRQIRRDIQALIWAGLIEPIPRDGRRSNTYRFLFHPIFEGASLSAQKKGTGSIARTSMTSQGNSSQFRPVASGHRCPGNDQLRGHSRPPNHKEINRIRESRASANVFRKAAEAEDKKYWKPSFKPHPNVYGLAVRNDGDEDPDSGATAKTAKEGQESIELE